KDISLPSVFVMQRVVESVTVSDYERMMQEGEASGDEAFTSDEIELRKMMTVDAGIEEKKEPVKFDTVFPEGDNRRFMVLGKPGSGKSTLLKYLMLEAVQKMLGNPRDIRSLSLPILVEIRKFENALSKTNRTDYNILDYLYDSMRKNYSLTLPKKFFEKYMDSGRVLLLFDGLDEVAAESRRVEIRQMISSFVTGYNPDNTVIVTSRIAGYSRAQFSTTDYRHFTLEDFNEEEVEEFIHKWYQSRLHNPAEAGEKAGDLKEAIEKKPRIKELAKSPLLLTIIAIIHRYEAQLPEDRLELYHKATEALLYTWDIGKGIIDEKFKLSHRRRFLEKVAFHLQSIEKGDEAGVVMDRDELYRILLSEFCQVFDCENWEAREMVDEFLEVIRTRAGLLVEQASEQYGFVHKTFQEYFAAMWMANESKDNYNLKIMIDYVDQFIDNAFWQETLLLALRALPARQTQKILELILNRDPIGLEPYFFHNHYFVMKFIAEQGQWLNNPVFVEKQVNDFIDFSWNEGRSRSTRVNKTWKRFQYWIPTVNDLSTRSILNEKFLFLAEDPKQVGSLRASCAKAVGKLEVKDKVAVDRLLLIAEDEKQDGDLRRSCAAVVGDLGFEDKAAHMLLNIAEDDTQPEYLKCSCLSVVEELGFKDKNAIERLFKLLEDENQPIEIRRRCATALGKRMDKDEAIAKRLIHIVEDDNQSDDLRSDCAFSVGKLGAKNKSVVDHLLRMAKDERKTGGVRRGCTFAVGKLGYKNKAVEILLQLANDANQGEDFRLDCALNIGKLGFKDKAVEILLQLANDANQSGDFRLDCASNIEKLGFMDKAVEILLHLAEDANQRDKLRRYCVQTIGNSRNEYKKVVNRLIQLAKDEGQTRGLRLDCVKAVEKLGLKDKALVEILLNFAEDVRQGGGLRRECVEAVGNSRVKNLAVVNRLIKLAEDCKQGAKLRRCCVLAVGNLGIKDIVVVDRLIRIAEDEKQSGGLRCDCAFAVGHLGFKDKAIEILLHIAEDEKVGGGLRSYASLSIGNLGLKDKAIELLFGLFEDKNQKEGIQRYCALNIFNLGVKEKMVGALIALAEDEKQSDGLRRFCAEALGNLGEKDKAVDILSKLYLAQKDKYEDEARLIYNSLWEMTEV
ncbi:MAG: NACHT domain-containing protein, partial [Candidatus Aminicenantes bacterium]|nr:NACHT domain-containing protein [Candidatus Aminicenantes bacterium]NIM80843.1 NACHT domain-containing protein [Candidatus Aminicenantes bacterium]NIN20227.1 NACHT domain-containing protein [Candidatus Aminicenantes bacterium]NIN44006.1 NACHT domain-containing protein [Candidatus Aminicenantes bacterium]NIN86815.1 NACHT domain-containing protein [Candidatus Aminicenantes bacterium]